MFPQRRFKINDEKTNQGKILKNNRKIYQLNFQNQRQNHELFSQISIIASKNLQLILSGEGKSYKIFASKDVFRTLIITKGEPLYKNN